MFCFALIINLVRSPSAQRSQYRNHDGVNWSKPKLQSSQIRSDGLINKEVFSRINVPILLNENTQEPRQLK